MEKQDVFRDTWIRYTAFASDFGEALRPFLGKGVYLGSYAVVAAYAIADTTDRGMRAYWRTHPQAQRHPQVRRAAAPPVATVTMASRPPTKIMVAAPVPATKHLSPVAATVFDSVLWHSAASLLLPYIVINRTVWAASKALAHASRLSPALRHSLPSLAGLAMIPLVVPHIDHAVDQWMDAAVRPRLNLLPEDTYEDKKHGGGVKTQQQQQRGMGGGGEGMHAKRH